MFHNNNSRHPTPTLSDWSNDDETSSSQSSFNGGVSSSVRPSKKQTQEVMKAFPPAEVTSETKKKTNWVYGNNTSTGKTGNRTANRNPGVHHVVKGAYDESFRLVEGTHKGVELMRLQRWHMVLPLSGTKLPQRDHKYVLVVRLKLKPNYKVKQTEEGKFYDVNAEDCRMNFNPEGCFLIHEAHLEWCKENPERLEGELAKFQEKNRNNKSKSYKECKNSVVRACQIVDKHLRHHFYEMYMDILYEKAFDAKMKSANSRAAVEEVMGKKPSNWQSKRSHEPWKEKKETKASQSIPTEDLFKPKSSTVPYPPSNEPMPTMIPCCVDKREAESKGHVAVSPPGSLTAPVDPNVHPSVALPPPGAYQQIPHVAAHHVPPHGAYPMAYHPHPAYHPHAPYGYYPQPAVYPPAHATGYPQAPYPAANYMHPPYPMQYMPPYPMHHYPVGATSS